MIVSLVPLYICHTYACIAAHWINLRKSRTNMYIIHQNIKIYLLDYAIYYIYEQNMYTQYNYITLVWY